MTDRRIQFTLDAARSEAVRRGHDLITPAHVAVVLGAEGSVSGGLDTTCVVAAERYLDGLAKTYGSPLVGDELQVLTDRALSVSDPMGTLRRDVAAAVLQSGTPAVIQGAQMSSADDTGTRVETIASTAPTQPGVVALPSGLAAVVDELSAGPTIIGRESVVDDILAVLSSRIPGVPVLVATAGSGRTAMAQALANRLRDPDYTGRLKELRVLKVRAERVITAGRSSILRRLLDEVAGRAIVVLDDFEVLAGLGYAGGADLEMWALLRSAYGDDRHRVVATLSDTFVERFKTADRELTDELTFIALPPLTTPQLDDVVRSAAAEIAAHHGVELPESTVVAALSAPAKRDTHTHPGLAIARLDRAAARASVRASKVVDPADVVTGELGAAAEIDPRRLRDELTATVFGQDSAIERVVRRLTVTRADLDIRPERPDGVFLFAGPTGTGKTALALALAKHLYGSENALLRLDMSEYVESHTVSKLVGSPPGYVGSTEPEAWLTTKISQQPHVLLLLDEIEKAHPIVWNTFLQVFDAGRLTDSRGVTAEFAHAVIVMTTNLGAEVFSSGKGAGFGTVESTAAADESSVLRTVKQIMAPELVNRLDDVLVFRPLTVDVVRSIARQQLVATCDRLAAQRWVVDVNESLVDHLASKGYSKEFGARALQRTIEDEFLHRVIELPKGHYVGSATDAKITLTVKS